MKNIFFYRRNSFQRRNVIVRAGGDIRFKIKNKKMSRMLDILKRRCFLKLRLHCCSQKIGKIVSIRLTTDSFFLQKITSPLACTITFSTPEKITDDRIKNIFNSSSFFQIVRIFRDIIVKINYIVRYFSLSLKD